MHRYNFFGFVSAVKISEFINNNLTFSRIGDFKAEYQLVTIYSSSSTIVPNFKWIDCPCSSNL